MTIFVPDTVPGQFTLVLHSHLPWLANHGRWPVGEEWLYQSWASSYQPVFAVLRGLAADGFKDVGSLGITPVLAAQLDDPYCLSSMYEWLANWQLRAMELATDRNSERAAAGSSHFRDATRAIDDFERHWQHGASPYIRALTSSGVIELLSGPLTHSFAPLLDARMRKFALSEGMADANRRWGYNPMGIWAPECAFYPSMELEYEDLGVGHFMVDGPALHGDTALGHPVGNTDVIAFGRDLTVSYRVWSPKSGYPGHSDYRDFHTYDPNSGFKLSRVTGKTVQGADKALYDPIRVNDVIDNHVEDFVNIVRRRLISESERIGRPAHVVAAFDTELFGHWWYEGPTWLDRMLRRLPEVGVSVGSLATARERGYIGNPVVIPPSSWGSGKDWRMWSGPQVKHLVDLNAEVVDTALIAVDKRKQYVTRDRVNDQILRETLITVASDWAFMVSKNTAAGYATERVHKHANGTREIAAAARGHESSACKLADSWFTTDNLFADLDARRMPGTEAYLKGKTR